MFLAKMPFGFILFFVSSPMGYSTRYYPPLGSSLSVYPFVQHSRSFCLFSSLPVCLSTLLHVSSSSANPYLCLQAYLPPLSLSLFSHASAYVYLSARLSVHVSNRNDERKTEPAIYWSARNREKLVSQWNKPEPACFCLPCHAPEAARNAGNDLRHSRHVLAGISLAGWSATFIVE